MSRRKTVAPNIVAVDQKIKSLGWSNAYFSGVLMQKGRGWTADWKRNSCFPSPEEAAKMCLLLNATPEEILTEPADIELVNGLIEQEREKQGIKKDLPQGEVGEKARKIFDFAENCTQEEMNDVLQYIDFIKSKRRK